MKRTPLEHHLRSIVAQRLEQLVTALDGARRDRGVEAVHDLRVASRRLRAFGVTFAELIDDESQRRLEKRLKRMTRAVAALRDLDVQLELLERRLIATSRELESAALEHLIEHLAERRAQAAHQAGRRLRPLDVKGLARRLQRALRAALVGLSKRDESSHARAVLERLVADAAERAPTSAGGEDPERLHLLRIDIKQLRYALELFEPVLGANFEALYARATALQELLGSHHDLVTLAEVIDERRAELQQRERHALVRGLDGVAEALSGEREALLARFQSQAFDADRWRATLQHSGDVD